MSRLLFRHFDKLIVVAIVIAALYLIATSVMGQRAVMQKQQEVSELVERANLLVANLPEPVYETPPALDATLRNYLKVPPGHKFRSDIFYRQGEWTLAGIALKLERGPQYYDYNEEFKKLGLPAEKNASIVACSTFDDAIAVLVNERALDKIRVVPKSNGVTAGKIRFEDARMIVFRIDVVKSELPVLAPPIIVSAEAGRGFVTIVFRRNENTFGLGTAKYEIERSTDPKGAFTTVGEKAAPASDQKPPRPLPAAAPEIPAPPPGPGEGFAPGPGPAPGPANEPRVAPAPGAPGAAAPAPPGGAEKPPEPGPGPRPPVKPPVTDPLRALGIEPITYVDSTVEPLRKYYYRVKATSIPDVDNPVQTAVSVAQELTTLPVIEVQLTGAAGNTATFTITRWTQGKPSQRAFFPTRGQPIGEQMRKVDYRANLMLVDFGTSPKWQVEVKPTRIYDPEQKNFVTVERRALKSVDTQWAVVYSPEGGPQLVWVERPRRLEDTTKVPTPPVKATPPAPK